MSDEKTDKRNLEEEIQEDLDIDDTQLDQELSKQPSKYFYYGATWAKSSRLRRKERLRLRELEATLCNAFRAKMAETNPGTRVTEAMLNNYLYNHPDYLKQEQVAIQAEYGEELMSIVKEAFKQRSQSLLELFRSNKEAEYYGNEFTAMRKEFEAGVDDKRKMKRRKKEIQAEETPEVVELKQHIV